MIWAGVLDDMSKTTNVYSRFFKRFNDGFKKDIPFISPTTGQTLNLKVKQLNQQVILKKGYQVFFDSYSRRRYLENL
jgi:hypothetical protein